MNRALIESQFDSRCKVSDGSFRRPIDLILRGTRRLPIAATDDHACGMYPLRVSIAV